MRQKRANIWSALPQVFFDIVWVYFSYWIALMLRFDGKVPWWEFEYFQIQIPWATGICLVVFFLCRFYTTMWQFASLDELIQIFFGVSISSVLIAAMGFHHGESCISYKSFADSRIFDGMGVDVPVCRRFAVCHSIVAPPEAQALPAG